MDEKEIIEILQDNIESLKNAKSFRHTNEEKIQAIQGLLDLYTKEKSKNEILGKTNKTLYNLCQTGAIQEFINNECNYIHKEKIKDKIRMYKAVDNTVGVRILELLLEDTDGRNNEIQNK